VTTKSDTLTQRQVRRLQQLPRGHKLVGSRAGSPLVRQPNGRLVRITPDGRLATAAVMKRVQSYLELGG
jgi:hypothetical protein